MPDGCLPVKKRGKQPFVQLSATPTTQSAALSSDIILEARDTVKNDPAELKAGHTWWNLVDILPQPVLHQVPHYDMVVAVDSLCGQMEHK